MRRDISWKTKRQDGTHYEVRVTFFGGKYKFQFKEDTAEEWDFRRPPAREDLVELIAGLRRRYQRRQVSDKEIKEAERLLNEMPESA